MMHSSMPPPSGNHSMGNHSMGNHSHSMTMMMSNVVPSSAGMSSLPGNIMTSVIGSPSLPTSTKVSFTFSLYINIIYQCWFDEVKS